MTESWKPIDIRHHLYNNVFGPVGVLITVNGVLEKTYDSATRTEVYKRVSLSKSVDGIIIGVRTGWGTDYSHVKSYENPIRIYQKYYLVAVSAYKTIKVHPDQIERVWEF
jgi:hypothetical protein